MDKCGEGGEKFCHIQTAVASISVF